MNTSQTDFGNLESVAAAERADIYIKLLLENQKDVDFGMFQDPEAFAKKLALLRSTLIQEFKNQPRNVRQQ